VDSNRSQCWAIKGSKPIKFTSGSKAKINIGSFYTEKEEFFWYDFGIKQNTDSFIKSLLKFNKDIGSKVLLLLDKAPWHKSKKAQEFFQKNNYWLKILYFSPATPDRNPTEECWKTTRGELTSRKSFKNIEALKKELKEFWEKHAFTHKMSHYLKWRLYQKIIEAPGEKEMVEILVTHFSGLLITHYYLLFSLNNLSPIKLKSKM